MQTARLVDAWLVDGPNQFVFIGTQRSIICLSGNTLSNILGGQTNLVAPTAMFKACSLGVTTMTILRRPGLAE